MKKILLIISTILISFIGINKLKASSVSSIDYGFYHTTNANGGSGDFAFTSYGKLPNTLYRMDGVASVGWDISSFSIDYKSPVQNVGQAYQIDTTIKVSYSGMGLNVGFKQGMIFHTATGGTYFKEGDTATSETLAGINNCDNWGSCTIVMSTYVTLKRTTTLKNLTSNYYSPQMFLCSAGSDNVCANVNIVIQSVDVVVNIVEDPNIVLNQQVVSQNKDIINQNQTIINQNQTVINQTNDLINKTQQTINVINNLNQTQQETNNKLDNIDDTIKDDDVNTDSASNFFDDFNTTDHGGLSTVITAPLSALMKITSTCTPINVTVLDKEITLPCGDTLFWNKPNVQSFRVIWNILLGGPILYGLLVKLFKVIEGLKNPDDDRIEVAKL